MITAPQLVELVKAGKHPLVHITDHLWDESFGCKGMIARVIGYLDKTDTDGTIRFTFDFNENREHNLRLDEPNWNLADGKQGSAIESGHFKHEDCCTDENDLKEEVYFGSTDPLPFELVKQNTHLAEYLDSGSKIPYVEWLEEQLTAVKVY
jgi:hypothetical protein